MNNSTNLLLNSSSINSTTSAASADVFDPSNVNLDVADPKQVICYLTFQDESSISDSDGDTGRMRIVHLSAVGVLFVISTASIMFPVLASRVSWLRLPLYVYLTMRYFGAGIIIATAFIHLLDPAYSEIGPQTCVGMTGSWTSYSWPPAIAMTSAMAVFLLDFMLECHVQVKYGLSNINVHGDMERALTRRQQERQQERQQQQQLNQSQQHSSSSSSQIMQQPAAPMDNNIVSSEHFNTDSSHTAVTTTTTTCLVSSSSSSSLENQQKTRATAVAIHASSSTTPLSTTTNHMTTTTTTNTTPPLPRTFAEQLTIFFVMELGVIFHSIVIGLTLGVAGTEFRTIYPVLAFHQCFEGLGIGTRMSAIPFPKATDSSVSTISTTTTTNTMSTIISHGYSFVCRHGRLLLPWFFCVLFGMIAPVAVAVGLSIRSTYHPESFTALAVSGVLDSIAAGILLYTGFVELLARDSLLFPERSLDKYRVSYMIVCLYLGIAIMGLLGKWA